MAKKGPSPLPEKRFPWRPWLLIAAVAVVAHGLCLRASFFLDDYMGIIEQPVVTEWTPATGVDWALPLATYRCVYAVFGPSSTAFHTVNLLLHVICSILTFELVKAWFPRVGIDSGTSSRAALWGALLFACHPLGSEITNYARCVDLELVTLFSLAAALAALRSIDHGWRWIPVTVVMMVAARYSKGPGVWHAVAIVGTVVVSSLTFTRVRSLVSSRRGRVVCGSAVLLAIAAVIIQFPKWQAVAASRASEGRTGWHLLTQSRIAWQYLRRTVWPTDLCVDHHIAWTMSAGDGPAWIAAGTLAAFSVAALWLLARGRSRIWGALLCLVLFPILLRFPFVSSELMVEYRMYPALPFVGVLGGLLLAKLLRRQPSIIPAAGGAVLLVFCLLSAARSTTWHSTHSICADVLKKYPTRLRAHWEAMAFDYRSGDFQAILDRRPAMDRTLKEISAFNRKRPHGRHYDFHHLAYSDISCRGYIARALARTGNQREARQLLESTKVNLIEGNNLTDSCSLGAFYYHRAMFHLESGRPASALADFAMAKEYHGFMPEIENHVRKARALAAEEAPPK